MGVARPNLGRTIGNNNHLADRIAHERQSRGWTMQQLADRMDEVGCTMHHTAIYKIEKGKPRRSVSFEEATAFAQVFDVSLDDLAMPVELVAETELLSLVARLVELQRDEYRIDRQRLRLHGELVELVKRHPRLKDVVKQHTEQFTEDGREVQHMMDVDPGEGITRYGFITMPPGVEMPSGLTMPEIPRKPKARKTTRELPDG